jgi:hypothetical protein
MVKTWKNREKYKKDEKICEKICVTLEKYEECWS